MSTLSMTVPIGGLLALIGVVLMALVARDRRSRVALSMLAIAGLAVAALGYLRISRREREDRTALLAERKHLCGSVAFHIMDARGRYAGGIQPPLAERYAALSALSNEVLVTWRMCVHHESACGALLPGLPPRPTEEILLKVQKCFEEGPLPLESARSFLEN